MAGAEIVASTAAAEEMGHVPPALLASLTTAPGEAGDLFRRVFGSFQFEGITLTPPTRTFDGRLDLEVGGRAVELIEVGPAHTQGDVLVHSPSDKTVFTGDILFIGGTPIVWAGPLSNWIAACDLMLGMDIETVVPGHGPVTDKAGVVQVRDYLVVHRRRSHRSPRRRDVGLGRGAGHHARLLRRVGRVRPGRRERRSHLSRARTRLRSCRHRRTVPPDGRAGAKGHSMTVRLGVDIGGSGIKGAPVDVEQGDLTADRFRIADAEEEAA